MSDAESLARLLSVLLMFEVRINRIASALGADYTIACNCRACRRWAALDLRRMVADGHGDRPISALRVRCSVCGERGVLQVRPPMPSISTATV